MLTTKRKPEPPVKQPDPVKDWPEREHDMLVLEAWIADIRAFRQEAEAKQAAERDAATRTGAAGHCRAELKTSATKTDGTE